MVLFSDRDPFGLGKWQDYLNQARFLLEHRLDATDVEKQLKLYKDKKLSWQVEQIQAVEKRRKAIKSKLLKCPDCNATMQILAVNKAASTQTGDDAKSVWICRKCHYDRFSNKTVKEELNVTS